MATNAEVDCNEKDYSNGKSEGNILIFICVKLYFLRQYQIYMYKLNPLVISMSQSGNYVSSNANCSNLFSKSFGVKSVFVYVLNTMNYLPKD